MALKATYRKLNNGDWGVKIDSSTPVNPYSIVTVTKKSGEQKDEKVKTRIAAGAGWQLWSIVPTTKLERSNEYGWAGRREEGQTRGYKACYMCGSWYCEGAHGGLCDDD